MRWAGLSLGFALLLFSPLFLSGQENLSPEMLEDLPRQTLIEIILDQDKSLKKVEEESKKEERISKERESLLNRRESRLNQWEKSLEMQEQIRAELLENHRTEVKYTFIDGTIKGAAITAAALILADFVTSR